MNYYSVLISILMALFFVGESAEALSNPCRHAPGYPLDMSLEEMVAGSVSIVYATAISYEPYEEGIYQGKYIFSPISELKGPPIPSFYVDGMDPYDDIPQHYFGTTSRHSNFDPEAVRLGGTSIIEESDVCVVAPKFYIGYNYLIFIGINSFSAYEPVHSTVDDHWFNSVRSEIERQRSVAID